MLPKVPRPMFGLWFGLVFLFGLVCRCCWDGECEVEALKLCWMGGMWMGVHVGNVSLVAQEFLSASPMLEKSAR